MVRGWGWFFNTVHTEGGAGSLSTFLNNQRKATNHSDDVDYILKYMGYYQDSMFSNIILTRKIAQTSLQKIYIYLRCYGHLVCYDN